MTFPQIEADAENTQIAAIFAIDQVAQPGFNGSHPRDEQIEIQQDDSQGQAVQALHSVQAGALQVKAIVFQIAKHFLDSLLANDKKVREGLQDGWG